MKSSDSGGAGPIQITQVGLTCSLGLDAGTACAAARAGLTRTQPFAGYRVVDADGEDAGLLAHAVPVGVDGFEGDARLLQLLTMALRGLAEGEAAAAFEPGATVAAYLTISDPTRWPVPGEVALEAEAAAHSTAARGPWLWSRAAAALAGRRLPELRHINDSGHTGFHRAVAQAARDIRAGSVQVALVAAVDSFIDAEGLGRLEVVGRLKTPSDPAGLQAGEAAGFVVLESAGAAQARQAPSLATLRALAFGREAHASAADGAPTGQGIAAALHDAARHLSFSKLLPMWAVSDHNGEAYRAMDWGNALVHIRARDMLQLQGSVLFPAGSLGDTGSASGLVALCLAAAAFGRGWAPSPVAALVSCADNGERSALFCQAG